LVKEVVCRKSQHTNQYGAITTEKQAVKKQVRNTIITKKNRVITSILNAEKAFIKQINSTEKKLKGK